MNTAQFQKSQYKADLMATVKSCEALRRDPDGATDVSLGEYVNKKYGITMEQFYEDLGLEPSIDTIDNIFTLPDDSVRWLIPEIIRDALRLGLRKAPIWSQLIAAEQTVKGLSVTAPHWNMSDAMPKFVGEGETIPFGNVSFGQKTFKVRKMARGIKIPYEVRQYVAISVISVYLQDFGVKLGQGLDSMLIDVLINGEQASGSESAPVVGVDTPTSVAYLDMLRVWIRMARIGRNPVAMIAGEQMAIDVLNLPEFKDRFTGTTQSKLNVKTPIPTSTDFYIHASVPDDQLIVVDSSSAVIKYNAQPLLVETEKIVSNQTEATYASLTTGYAIVFRDARVILDQTLDFTTNGFPSYMDVDAIEQEMITND